MTTQRIAIDPGTLEQIELVFVRRGPRALTTHLRELHPETVRRIGDLAAARGWTEAEVIRRAVGLLDAARGSVVVTPAAQPAPTLITVPREKKAPAAGGERRGPAGGGDACRGR